MKNVQLFITRHYDAIKLVLLTICVVLLGYIILTNIAANQAAQERRTRGIAEAVKLINDKSDEQTDQLHRQLQALCYIIIITAGEDALRQIDPPLEEQCKDLSADLRARQPIMQPAQPEKQTQRAVPQEEPVSSPQPTPPQQRGIIESTLKRANGILNGLLRR